MLARYEKRISKNVYAEEREEIKNIKDFIVQQ